MDGMLQSIRTSVGTEKISSNGRVLTYLTGTGVFPDRLCSPAIWVAVKAEYAGHS